MLFDAVIIFALLLLIIGSLIYAGSQIVEMYKDRDPS